MGWSTEKNSFSVNLLMNSRILFTGTTTQLIDGLGLKFLSGNQWDKDFYYTVDLKIF